jgi:hypothetical protein
MDKDGAVVGLLDIAKCLYDAISVLERVDTESENNNSSTGVYTCMNLCMKYSI